MKHLIHIGDKPISLISEDFEEKLYIDEICKINYANLYGESVTIPALMNKVGMIKANAEADVSKAKLQLEIYESKLKKDIRVEAGKNGGKFLVGDEWVKLTEKSLDEAVVLDEGYQDKKLLLIESSENLGMVDSLYWAVGEKSRKLNNLVKQVTPEEFLEELVEGKVNTFIVKKL